MDSIKRHRGFSFSLLISISLMAYSCGGGGGTSAAPANAKAAAAATKSVISAFAASDSGTSTNSTLKPASKAENNTIRKGILGLKTRLQSGNSRQKTLRASSPATCLPGGTGTITSNETSFTETYSNCDQNNGNGTILRKNGSIANTFTENSFTSAFTNYEESVIRTTDGVLLQSEKTDGTLIMSSGTLTPCNNEIFFNNAVITLNATFEEKVDEDGNG